MITAGDFRNGMTFEEDGNVLQIVEFQHVKPGKGAAFVRTKIKNVITGSVVENLALVGTYLAHHLLLDKLEVVGKLSGADRLLLIGLRVHKVVNIHFLRRL